MKQVYIIIGAIIVIIISYLIFINMTRASETYIDAPFNLIVVDGNGNISPIAIRPPSLDGIPSSSNLVYVDSSGNIGTMTIGDVYTSYQGNSTNNIRNLLTIDANNNFGVLSTLNFNPCHVNGDPATNPNATMNGIPQRDGTCKCRNSWSGSVKGDGCAVCDGGGPDCIYSNAELCNGHGKMIDYDNRLCACDPSYAGRNCEFDGNVLCGNGSRIVEMTTGFPYKCLNCGDSNRDITKQCNACNPGWKPVWIPPPQGFGSYDLKCVR